MSSYVGNLLNKAGQDDLRQAFPEHGSVKSVQLPTERETVQMSGFTSTPSGSSYA